MKALTPILLVLISACAGQTTPPAAPAVDVTVVAPTPGYAEPIAPREPISGGFDADAPMPSRDFVGRWAASRELCASSTWEIGPDSLSTPAGTSCTLGEVRLANGVFQAPATCSAEGPSQATTLQLQVIDEEGSSLRVDGGPFVGPVELISCTPRSEGPGTE